MLGLVRRKQLEQKMLELKETADRAESQERLAEARQAALYDLGSAFERRTQELADAQTKGQAAEDAKELAEERCRAAEAECMRMGASHVGRPRIFTMPIDVLEMTARARAIEGSLRCQWSADERAVICDGGRPLTEAEFNAVVAVVTPKMDRT